MSDILSLIHRKAPKSSFFEIWKVLILSFHWKKIHAVGILDRFAAYFETKLILASRRLANWTDTGN